MEQIYMHMSTGDLLANETTHVSLDVNENSGQETVVGYPVNSEWFFRSIGRSSHETNTIKTNVCRQHPIDETHSTDLTNRLLNDTTHPDNPTHRTRGTSNRRAITNSDKWSCFDSGTWGTWSWYFAFNLVLLLFSLVLFVLLVLLEIPTPFNFTVISLDVSSLTTISNNASVSNIQNYMSADLNLTLSISNQIYNPLLIEHLEVSIKYSNATISSAKIGPLYEESRGHETIHLHMGIKEARLPDATFDSMLKDLAINRTLEFTVIMLGKYDILNKMQASKHAVQIICDSNPVHFASNLSTGTLVDAPRLCKGTALTR